MKREELEERLVKFKPRITETIQAALKDAGMDLHSINDVEIIGSGLRVPIIKNIIAESLNNVCQSISHIPIGDQDRTET